MAASARQTGARSASAPPFGTPVLLGALLAALLLTDPAPAQGTPATGEGGAGAAFPAVVEVVSDRPGRPNEAGLGDRMTVTVENLPLLLDMVGGDCRRIVLFLGGVPIQGLPPERCDPDNGHVGFYLERTESADRSWRALLGSPVGFTRPVRVTVGSSESRSFPTSVENSFDLVVLPRRSFYLFLVVWFVSLGLLLVLARRSNLIREPVVLPLPGAERPFSLARFQLAFWSLLVVEAYFFVWLVTGELSTLTDSVLGLIGVGSGTALGAAMIDASKRDRAGAEGRKLRLEAGTLDSALERLEVELTTTTDPDARKRLVEDLATKQSRRAQLKEQIANLPSPEAHTPSGGFLVDVLSDAQGISIHRFQMLLWTLTLGLIFCDSVYRSLRMPEFSPSLLALMGLSSATYLGFKIPEKSGPGESTAGSRG